MLGKGLLVKLALFGEFVGTDGVVAVFIELFVELGNALVAFRESFFLLGKGLLVKLALFGELVGGRGVFAGFVELFVELGDGLVSLGEGFAELFGLEEIHLKFFLHQMQLLKGEFGLFPGRLELVLRQGLGRLHGKVRLNVGRATASGHNSGPAPAGRRA